MVVDDENGLGEEAQRGFAVGESLDAYSSLHQTVLVSYRYRCALTGARFAPPTMALHPDLEVTAIQPREQGGPLAIANYLPMITSLTAVFRDGLVIVEDDFRIRAPHPDLLDHGLLSALRTSLVLPEAPFRPGTEYLAHHRRYALGR